MNDKFTCPSLRIIMDFNTTISDLLHMFHRHNYEARIVGGAVRDYILNKEPSDIDIATTATPIQMKETFEKENIHVLRRPGEAYGTITCRINNENFEITTLRIDVKTNGRLADVKFITDWYLDASRRDFTINSMYIDSNGILYDYFDGYKDVQNKVVRFVGDANIRICEDYLRIVRYFRFVSMLSSDIDISVHEPTVLESIKLHSSGLSHITGERIWMELKKIFNGKHVYSILRTMSETTVLYNCAFPQSINLVELERVSKLENVHYMAIICSMLTSSNQLYDVSNRLKFSKRDLRLGLFLIRHRDQPVGQDYLYSYCQDLLCENVSLYYVDTLLKYHNLNDTIVRIKEWEIPKFPINGTKLIRMGYHRGKIETILVDLKQYWKESRYTITKAMLLKYCKHKHV